MKAIFSMIHNNKKSEFKYIESRELIAFYELPI